MSRLFCTFAIEKETSSTPNPQAPEGHKIMNHELKENFFNFVQAVESTAKLSVIDEINNRLMNKLKVYDNLLNSREAWNTYLSSHGKKWEEMRKLRTSLQAKERLIEELGGMIEDIKYNEILTKNQ